MDIFGSKCGVCILFELVMSIGHTFSHVPFLCENSLKMSVSMATKFRAYMGNLVEQNVPLTFQMGTFLNKIECFKCFY